MPTWNIQPEKNKRNRSDHFWISQDYVNKYKVADFFAEPGDVGFFQMDIFHRSGKNTSNLFRFVAIARYHRILTDDFNVGELIYRVVEGQ